MNYYAPHVFLIPEDDRNRQIAQGFVDHYAVDHRRIRVMPVARGWHHALDIFREEYIPKLHNYPQAHVVLLIDFDGHTEERLAEFKKAIPKDVEPRVFVVGSRNNPETLKRSLNATFEEIGESLADECNANTSDRWEHAQLEHNNSERLRLIETVKPFLL